MQNSSHFFSNTNCEYFPCHKNAASDFNCLFCYCPMYRITHCPGNPSYFTRDGKTIKDCTNCTFPHNPENYDTVIEVLRKNK